MKKIILIFFLILIIALSLRLYHLGKYSLWYDESIVVLDEWGLNRLPPIAKLIDFNFLLENHDYLTLYSHGFVYYWQILFGKAEFVLRLSSVIFGLFSIYLLYLLGKDFFNTRIALLAALLLSISPFHIYYSQELRPYAATAFFTLVAVYFFLKIIKGGNNKYWFIYIIANILNIYFLYMTLLVLFSFCLFFILNIKRYKHLLKPFIIAHTIIIFLVIPIFLNLYPNLKFILHNEMLPELTDFPIWAGKLNFVNLLFTLKNFSIGYNLDFHSFVGKFITFAYLMLFLVGVYKAYKITGMGLILCCLSVPILTLFLISKIKTCYVDRYFFAVFPLYLLTAAAGLDRFSKKTFLVFVIIIICFNFLGLKNYYLNYLPKDSIQHIGVVEKQNIKEIAKVLSDNYKSGDRIMHVCRNTVFPLKFYVKQISYNADLIEEIDKGTAIVDYNYHGKEGLFIVYYNKLHPMPFLPELFPAAKELGRINKFWLIYSDWHFNGFGNSKYEIVNKIREKFIEEGFFEFKSAFVYLFYKK